MMRTSSAWLASLTIGLPFLGSLWALLDAVQHGIVRSNLVLLGVMYVVCAFGTETGFHRMLSHRAFQTTAPVRAILCVLGSMALQGSPLFWAAVHRQHHACTDRDGDPHSPYSGSDGSLTVVGFIRAHIGWLFIPAKPGFRPTINDLLRDPVVVGVSRLYPLWAVIGIALPALIGGCLIGTAGGALRAALWGGAIRIAVWQQVTWSVNSFGHVFGSRAFATRDHSTNNLWLVPLTLGGAWHNNHHAFPSSARVGLGAWQVDVHYWLICALSSLGLVSKMKIPSGNGFAPRKQEVCDDQT